jgi:hypothetical protein
MPREIEVVFQPLPRQSISTDPRYLQNVGEGADVEILNEFLLTKMPALDEKKVTTIYRIVYTERREETPSSFPKLRAIVEIRCYGCISEAWEEIRGFYEIFIQGCAKETKVVCSKLVSSQQFSAVLRSMPPMSGLYNALQ